MADLACFPYFEFEVRKDGSVHDEGAAGRIAQAFAQHDWTDAFIFSHGWNNDMAEARDLYARLFAGVRVLLDTGAHGLGDRRFAVVGILWPSKKFADEDITAGGGLSVGDPAVAGIALELKRLEDAFDNPDAPRILRDAGGLLDKLQDSPAARKRFAELLRELPGHAADRDAGAGEDASAQFFGMDAGDLMDSLAGAYAAAAPPSGDGGGEAGWNPFAPIFAAAGNVLNLTTYYQMKARAGLVGRTGVTDLVRAIQESAPQTRLHLAGHSFGARLVTQVALGPAGQAPRRLGSLTLIQAAFSHNGFADQSDPAGFFRAVLQDKRVAGPILATHSSHDKPVGLAYPLASRIAGQNTDSFGGADDPYGGLGRNGAQKTTGVTALKLPLPEAAVLQRGGFYNLEAENVIFGHSDICKPEVYDALLRAVAA